MRHGPHHGAQKSTSNGTSLRARCLSKLVSSTASGWAVNSGRWHLPQSGALCRCWAATRLVARQCGQTRCNGSGVDMAGAPRRVMPACWGGCSGFSIDTALGILILPARRSKQLLDQPHHKAQQHRAGQRNEPIAPKSVKAEITRQLAQPDFLQKRTQPIYEQQRQRNDDQPAEHNV